MSDVETGLSLNVHVYRIPIVTTDLFCIKEFYKATSAKIFIVKLKDIVFTI